MSIENILALLFIIGLLVFIILKRKKIQLQKILFPFLYFAMYKTRIGIKLMDKSAKKFPKILNFLAVAGIVTGFIGMLLISFELVRSTLLLLYKPEAAPGIMPVLPIEAKGVFFVPFLYWVISIFVIATVHEFAHGVISRLYNVKVKSSGFAVLGILVPLIPAAFVEPDEKNLSKRPKKQQLGVFAAGPFANILCALVVFLIMVLILKPISGLIFMPAGVTVESFDEISPAKEEGLITGSVIKTVNGINFATVEEFSDKMEKLKPGELVGIGTDKKKFEVTLAQNPEDSADGHLGVFVRQHLELKPAYSLFDGWVVEVFKWGVGLFQWIFLLNIGIGLFNLLPIGPVDGGRMFHVALQKFFKPAKSYRYWKFVSIFFVSLVLANLLAGFIR